MHRGKKWNKNEFSPQQSPRKILIRNRARIFVWWSCGFAIGEKAVARNHLGQEAVLVAIGWVGKNPNNIFRSHTPNSDDSIL